MKKYYYCNAVPFPMSEEVYQKHKEECLLCANKDTIIGKLIKWLLK